MTFRTQSIVALGLCLPLLLTGCVVLSGQRITLHYDAQKDILSLLICYDGVYNSAQDAGDAEENLQKLVQDGNFMLLDWFGQVQPATIRETAGRSSADPEEQALLHAFADNLTVQTLGHYRDIQGRIGGAQLVQLKQASKVVKLANEALNVAIREARPDSDEDMRRTLESMIKAARKGYEWIRIDGHSLTFQCPVNSDELAAHRYELLRQMCEQFGRESGQSSDIGMRTLLHLLTSAPVSIEQSSGHVRLRIGSPERPTTLRIHMGRTYLNNFDEVLVRHVPKNLDVALLEEALGKGPAVLPNWAPREHQVRAVLKEARTNKDGSRSSAWLEGFALEWNAAGNWPVAPEKATSAQDLKAWVRWLEARNGTFEFPRD